MRGTTPCGKHRNRESSFEFACRWHKMSQLQTQHLRCLSPRSTELCLRVPINSSTPWFLPLPCVLSCFLFQCFNGDPPFLSGVPQSSTATVLSSLRTVEPTRLIQSRCPRTWPANDHRMRQGVKGRRQPNTSRMQHCTIM